MDTYLGLILILARTLNTSGLDELFRILNSIKGIKLRQPQWNNTTLEHKKDLINRLKRSDTHNIPAYEAEMSRHMTLHEDVLERILNILKQDDYYRTLEDLPVIDELTAYDDIRLFPELYDTSTIIERVTAEADLIERQLR